MKSFRQYLVEESRKDLEDLRKEVRKLPNSKIQRSTNSGFYVAVDCKKDSNGTYEVTDNMATSLNGLESSWNTYHSNKIEWGMPDSTKEEVYISFKKI